MTLVLKKIIKEDKPKIKTRADIEMKQVIGLIQKRDNYIFKEINLIEGKSNIKEIIMVLIKMNINMKIEKPEDSSNLIMQKIKKTKI